ncbi:MAG: hypothetical protein RL563_1610 [Pseudomonadota bacterium]|jgi:hypothetical protein
MIKKILAFGLLMVVMAPGHTETEPSTLDYAVDIGFYRPFGALTTILGATGFIVTLPTSLIASVFSWEESISEAGREFVYEPASFTFNRPLGESLQKWHSQLRTKE